MAKYFDLEKSWNSIRLSSGAAQTAEQATIFAGKLISNTIVFGVTEVLPSVISSVHGKSIDRANTKLENEDLSSEDRARIESAKERAIENKAAAEALREKWK